jgi:integrase
MRPGVTGSVYLRGRIWWIKFYDRLGNARYESSRSTLKSDADTLLRKRLGEVATGRRLIGTDVERTTFEDLERMTVDDYRINGRKSLDTVQASFRALRQQFASWRARDMTYDELASYAAARLEAGHKPATVRRELAVLHRAFVLAVRAGKAECPPFPTMHVENARTGFFEEGDWKAIRSHLPDYCQGVGDFAFVIGWRIMEILTLTWRHIEPGVIRLDPGTTKSGEGRVFPFGVHPGLAALIARQRELTDKAQRINGRIVPWVFHNSFGKPLFTDGRPKKSFREAWQRASKAAGLPGRLIHDFRRTAVRNFERAGVPRGVAMKLVGMKSESIYRRYNIVAEADLTEGVRRLAAAGAATVTIAVTSGREKDGKDAV